MNKTYFFVLFIVFFVFTAFSKPKKEIIYTPEAPKPIGPYSQAVAVGNYIFVSGQIGIDPKTNNIVEGDIEAEFRQAMENIKAILKQAKSNLDLVVKVSIFLTKIEDFAKINKIYQEYFKNNYPARETVEVSALPKNAKVEISVIAIRGNK